MYNISFCSNFSVLSRKNLMIKIFVFLLFTPMDIFSNLYCNEFHITNSLCSIGTDRIQFFNKIQTLLCRSLPLSEWLFYIFSWWDWFLTFIFEFSSLSKSSLFQPAFLCIELGSFLRRKKLKGRVEVLCCLEVIIFLGVF